MQGHKRRSGENIELGFHLYQLPSSVRTGKKKQGSVGKEIRTGSRPQPRRISPAPPNPAVVGCVASAGIGIAGPATTPAPTRFFPHPPASLSVGQEGGVGRSFLRQSEHGGIGRGGGGGAENQQSSAMGVTPPSHAVPGRVTLRQRIRQGSREVSGSTRDHNNNSPIFASSMGSVSSSPAMIDTAAAAAPATQMGENGRTTTTAGGGISSAPATPSYVSAPLAMRISDDPDQAGALMATTIIASSSTTAPKLSAPASSSRTALTSTIARSGNGVAEDDNAMMDAVSEEEREVEGANGTASQKGTTKKRVNPLEETLQYLLAVEEQRLPEEVVSALKLLVKALKHDRQAKRGQQPFRDLALLETEKNTEVRAMLTALAEAARAGNTVQQSCAPLERVLGNSAAISSVTALSSSAVLSPAGTAAAGGAPKPGGVPTSAMLSLRKKSKTLPHALLHVIKVAWAELQLEAIFSGTHPLLQRLSSSVSNTNNPIHSSTSGGAPRTQTASASAEEEVGHLVTQCFRFLDEAIEMGHPGAMFLVGCSLRDGKGMPVDLESGVSWIERAAAVGYVPAMHEMGEMFERGVERGEMELDADWGEAMHWYQRAAEKNCTSSQLNLGKLLLSACMQSGASVVGAEEREEMLVRSRDWLDLAAATGNQEALRLRERV